MFSEQIKHELSLFPIGVINKLVFKYFYIEQKLIYTKYFNFRINEYNIEMLKYLIRMYLMVQCACLQPNYCVNCKHFRSQFPFPKEFGKCNLFPIIVKDENYVVTGIKKQKTDYNYCSVVRHYDKCGEEGKLYEEKNKMY